MSIVEPHRPTPRYRDPLNPTMMTAIERQRAARRERLMRRVIGGLSPTWGVAAYSIAATVVEVLWDELDA